MGGINLTTLPQELILAVIDQLDSSPAIASLSQTCRLFNHLATPRLYTSPSVAGSKLRRFVESVYEREYECTIRHLAIHNVPRDMFSDAPLNPVRDSLRNLESLYVHGDQTWVWFWHNIAGSTEPPASLTEPLKPPRPLTGWALPALRSLTLKLNMAIGTAVFLDGILFRIPQLEELTVHNVQWSEIDLEIESKGYAKYKGSKKLKILRFYRSYVEFNALRNVLQMPKALTHLCVEHVEGLYAVGATSGLKANRATIPEFEDALAPHKHSLQELELTYIAGYGRIRPPLVVDQPGFDTSGFSALRRCVGCDTDQLRGYLGADRRG